MAMNRAQRYRQMVARSKYQRLYTHLCGLTTQEWRTSFSEVEAIIGFELPPSARLHRPWWSNQTAGNGHSRALSWSAAVWETAEVNMDAETLLMRREPTEDARRLTLDEAWPVHSTGAWPRGLSLQGEDFYDERI